MDGKIKDNSNYDFKTLKVKPSTHKKLIRFKSRVEMENGSLISFDKIISFLIDNHEKKS